MSYCTLADFNTSEVLETETVLARMRAYLESDSRYPVDYVLSCLREGWDHGRAEFKGLVCADFVALMQSVSAGFPSTRFYVRGIGEEIADIWLRVFESGKVVFAKGPFESEFEAIDRLA